MVFSTSNAKLIGQPVALLSCMAVLACTAPVSLSAQEFEVGNIRISHPWARATPKGAKVGGGYMKITNMGTGSDRLVGGKTAVAERLEIHEMRINNGIMRMRRLPKGLEIPPGKTVELKPGGYHVMFMKLAKGLKKHQPFTATLNFETSGRIQVKFKVEAIGAVSSGGSNAGSNHGSTHGKHKQ